MTRINLTVDGAKVADDVEPRMLLVQYLREKLGKTGTVVGCDTSNCGACTVHLDGTSVKSCNVLAVAVDGSEVTTIEGLAKTWQGPGLHPMQQAWLDHDVAQCGYCQPGQIMAAVALVQKVRREGRKIRDKDLDGIRNICRCGSYTRIREAIEQGARQMR